MDLYVKPETEDGADSNYDKKQFADHALILEILIFAWVPMKPMVDLFVTIPMALVANYLFVRASYALEDENMACFTDPENFADSKLAIQQVTLLVSCLFWFFVKKHKVNVFMQQIRAE